MCVHLSGRNGCVIFHIQTYSRLLWRELIRTERAHTTSRRQPPFLVVLNRKYAQRERETTRVGTERTHARTQLWRNPATLCWWWRNTILTTTTTRTTKTTPPPKHQRIQQQRARPFAIRAECTHARTHASSTRVSTHERARAQPATVCVCIHCPHTSYI